MASYQYLISISYILKPFFDKRKFLLTFQDITFRWYRVFKKELDKAIHALVTIDTKARSPPIHPKKKNKTTIFHCFFLPVNLRESKLKAHQWIVIYFSFQCSIMFISMFSCYLHINWSMRSMYYEGTGYEIY